MYMYIYVYMNIRLSWKWMNMVHTLKLGIHWFSLESNKKRISKAQPVPVPNVNRLSPPTIHPATRWVSWTRWRRFRPCHNRLSPWHHRPGRREPWAERRGVAGPTGSGHDPAVAEAKIVYNMLLQCIGPGKPTVQTWQHVFVSMNVRGCCKVSLKPISDLKRSFQIGMSIDVCMYVCLYGWMDGWMHARTHVRT